MRITEALRVAAALLLACAIGASGAAEPPPSESGPAPRIGVVTMAPGGIFWERFGHDAIVVDDPLRGEPIAYNFGYFDLAEDGFIGRFVRGEMEYMLVALPLAQDMQYYREVGRGATCNGSTWIPARPAAWPQPGENARRKTRAIATTTHRNCATRVRDALDRAWMATEPRWTCARAATLIAANPCAWPPASWMWLGFDIGLGRSRTGRCRAGSRPSCRAGWRTTCAWQGARMVARW